MRRNEKYSRGRSDKITNKPIFLTLIMSPLATLSALGYKGAHSKNSWTYYLKDNKLVAKSLIASFLLFSGLNYLYSYNIESFKVDPRAKRDVKQIKADIKRLGLVQDEKPDRK